jgi:thymidylate synthase (FAD)
MAATMFNGDWCPVLSEVGMKWNTGTSAEALIEFAGRNCYQSWSNPGKKTNAEYIKNIIEHGHGSVLEHASCTFFITGVSRSLTHEMTRHRHLSFSELSQRFVDMKTAEFICPNDADWESWGFFIDEVKKEYKEIQTELGDMGLTRKQVNERARAVLPNATCTSIVVSGNLRAWRSFIDARANEHADAEICALAVEICTQLKERFPNVFQDYIIDGGFAYTHNRKV